MNMRASGKCRSVLTAILCVLLVLGTFLSLPTATASTISTFHYGNPNLQNNRSMSASDLFARLFGFSPSEAETAYLNTQPQLELLYSDTIPDSIVSTYYDGEAGTLDVSLNSYTFRAANGALVEWVPTKAEIGDTVLDFEKGADGYFCRFTELFRSEDYRMNIHFEWSLQVPAEQADTLLNAGYYAGSVALEELQAYETELAAYKEKENAYLAYQNHEQAVNAYAAYEAAYAVYLEEKQVYDVYAAEYAAYTEQMQRYQAWRDYYAYVENARDYPERRKAYLEYQSEVQKVMDTLQVMEALFLPDSNYWRHYVSLKGNLVTQVVDRRNELVAAGCDPAHIEAAAEATRALRGTAESTGLMEGYAELRKAKYNSDHERYTALYQYYTEHYEELRDNYKKLYGALVALYGNSFVVEGLRNEGKLLHFQQFVGQLYVTATALDDAQPRLQSWAISGKSLHQVVEPVHLVKDADLADPTTNGVRMPEKEVAFVGELEVVEKPTFDDPPKPTAPTYVKEPIEPTPVAPPASVAPPVAEHPGDAPTEPQMSSELRALAEQIRVGTLTKRAEREAQTVVFSRQISCPVSILNLMTVTFYDMDGVTVLDEQTLEYGSEVIYRGPSTDRAPDERYVYTFLGWIEANGTSADLGRLTRNLSLYANYQLKERTYRVTWKVDGYEPLYTYHRWGEIPTYPNELTKDATERYVYEFSGWSPAPAAVSGEAVYSGSFVAKPRKYSITWNVDGVLTQESYEYGSVPYYKSETPQREADTYRYTFSGWLGENNAVPTSVTRDEVYTATFRKTALATGLDGTVFEVVPSETALTVLATKDSVLYSEALSVAKQTNRALILQWGRVSLCLDRAALDLLDGSRCKRIELQPSESEEGTELRLCYLTSSGNDTGLTIPAKLLLTDAAIGDEYAAFYFRSGEEWVIAEASEMSLTGGTSFLMKCGYALRVTPTKNCNVNALPEYVAAGERVDLRLTCALGYEVTGARVVTVSGVEIPVEDLSFVMPSEAVSIELTVSPIVYHVTFMVGGEIYHEADYAPGAEIVLPQPPSLAPDGQYSYTFLGWSPSVTIAAGEDRNPIYHAQFSKTALQGTDPYKQEGNSNRVITVVLPIVCAASALAAGIVIWRKKRRR